MEIFWVNIYLDLNRVYNLSPFSSMDRENHGRKNFRQTIGNTRDYRLKQASSIEEWD